MLVSLLLLIFLSLSLYLLFTNLFCLMNQQKITKGKFDTNLIYCLVTYFGMNKPILRVYVFIHACGKVHVLSMYVMKLE